MTPKMRHAATPPPMTPLLLVFTLLRECGALQYDIVVYGSSPAGIAAATAAGHLGLSVALFEPLNMIGGMGAAGNLALHDGQTGTFTGTGLALNFSLLNAAHYNVQEPVAQPESFVANASFFQLLSSAGVRKVALGCRLTSAAAGRAGSLASIAVSCEREPVTALCFIDASYDGEVMVAVGTVEYTAGREAASQYNERLAGARKPTQGKVVVNAMRDDGTLMKYVQNVSDLRPPGEADDALMAFQHRFCISGDDDRVPWSKPAGYNPEDFLIFQRYIEASDGTFTGFQWPPQDMHDHGYPGPKKKYTLCCGISIAASDQPHLNKGWASASWERKQEMIAEHTYFELGMLYFLANDRRVPRSVRDEFNRYGLCSDEFQEFGYVPPQLYIRESNRLVGDFVLTQNNIAEPRYRNDSIAVGAWWLDKHMTGKYAVATEDGTGFTVQLEGNFPHEPDTSPPSYDVPFRLMVPKRGTGTNLLVPVCLSVSSAAFASTRIETMLMGTGTAAGVAAKQLVDGTAGTVHDINVSQVQLILTDVFRQRIHYDDRRVRTPVKEARRQGRATSISNVSPRLDEKGDVVIGGDGNVLANSADGYYYYYSQNYGECRSVAVNGSLCVFPLNRTCGYLYNQSVAVYRSRDLASWELLTKDAFPGAPPGVHFRVKVVFNPSTALYVMWVRVVPIIGGADGKKPDWLNEAYAAGTSRSPAGPFTLASRVIQVRYGPGGDNTLFVDDDGAAYVAYTSHPTGLRISVERLAPDFLSSTNESSGAFGPRGVEAPAMWKRGLYYYVSTGPTCCYCQAGSDVVVLASKSPLGPYEAVGGALWADRAQTHAQQNYVFQVGAQWIWTGTRWGSAQDGLFAHDFQTWLPFEWDDDADPPVPLPLRWRDSFEVPSPPKLST